MFALPLDLAFNFLDFSDVSENPRVDAVLRFLTEVRIALIRIGFVIRRGHHRIDRRRIRPIMLSLLKLIRFRPRIHPSGFLVWISAVGAPFADAPGFLLAIISLRWLPARTSDLRGISVLRLRIQFGF